MEVDEKGRITGYGQDGGGLMGATTVKLGPVARTFEAIGLPDIAPKPVKGDGWVSFTQTAGGRTGVPAPRRVRRKPFVQWQAPLVWTTLSLTMHADGRVQGQMTGASQFPRHWVYDDEVRLSHKSGLADFKDWYRKSFGRHTPWGDTDSKALVTAVETALERDAVGADHAGRRQARDPQGQGRRRARQAGRDAARRCSCCSTACCASRRTACAWPSTAPARCWASARTGGGPAHLDARRGDALPGGGRAGRELDRGALRELSKDHRRTRPD